MIYVWNTNTNLPVTVDCTIQRGVIEPWIASELVVGCKKTKVYAEYPLCMKHTWIACMLKLQTPVAAADEPHSMMIEIWCS